MRTIGALNVTNTRSGRLLPGAPVTVTDLDGTPLETYTADDQPAPVVSNHEGHVPAFRVDSDAFVFWVRPRGGTPVAVPALEGLGEAASLADTINSGRLSETSLNATFATHERLTEVATGQEAALTDSAITGALTAPGSTSQGAVDTAVAAFVTDAGTAAGQALADAFGPFITGNAGKKYRLVGAPLRNTGAPDYWQPIVDSGHEPIIGTVTTDATRITVGYGFTAKKVVTAAVVPDESLARQGYDMGPSVGLSEMRISLYRTNISGYVAYNGTSWSTIGIGFRNPTFNPSTGALRLEHDTIGGASAVASLRDGNRHVSVGALTATSTEIHFRDLAGAKLLAPDTTMRVYVNRFGSGVSGIDPRVAGLGAGDNIWVYALLEV